VKKAILFLMISGLAACSDGELQIETIDFDEETLQFCGTATTSTELLFKISETEVLILQLQSGLLENETSTDTIISSIPGESQLIYRALNDNASTAYFCDPIPPATPTVIEEIPAEAGNVRIFTTQSANDTTSYEHDIRLAGVSFVNEAGERITNLFVSNFGTLVTSD
jgi:hypothetical protein